ncbi:MAG: NAD(P)/FAD-dependent oxidoreductase [Ginsengibacter sp.]
MYDIIIVGGGAAGLMAAKILSEAGRKILLLEARDQLGGRIQQLNNFSFPAEGGAEFIHGNLKTTFDLLKEAGMKKEKIKGQFCRAEKGKWLVNSEPVPHWNLLIKKMKACNEDMTVDDFLVKYFSKKKYDVLRTQFKKYVEGYDAADTNYVSVLSLKNEMENEDGVQYRPVAGYTSLINFLKETTVKNDAVIKTGEPVKEIMMTNKIEVITSSGKYFSKKIIIAVPVGVLQARKNNKSFIRFPSLLNNYITAAKKIGNGGVIKFLLEFDKTFWLEKKFLKNKKIPAPSYIFSEEIIPTWWTQFPSMVPLLTGWLAGPQSGRMKSFSTKKFESIMLDSLSSIMFVKKSELEQKLLNYEIMNWIDEPHILGGYSYTTLKTEKARKILLTPYKDTFYFAGEYVTQNSPSTVDAALQSGKLVAMEILKEK